MFYSIQACILFHKNYSYAHCSINFFLYFSSLNLFLYPPNFFALLIQNYLKQLSLSFVTFSTICILRISFQLPCLVIYQLRRFSLFCNRKMIPIQVLRIAALFSILVFLYVGSIYIFCKGFLLSRVEIANVSQCPAKFSRSVPHKSDAAAGGSICEMDRPFRRIVLIIIDALRYDFVTCPSPLHTNPYFHNKVSA